MTRLALVSVLAVALLLPAATTSASPAGGSALATQRCAKETKRLNAFRKGMAAKKRRFFRTHKAAKARRAFTRRQTKRLKALKRARRRCLAKPQPSPGPAQTPAPPTPLPGNPDNSALTAMTDVVTDDALVSDSEVTGGVVRTQVQLAFARNATIDAVNALLDRIGGRIVSSRRGVLVAVVEVPDPGSLDAHADLLASLAGDPVVRHALPVFLPPPDDLPEHIAFGTPETAFVRSQAAVHAPAAWNARAALAGRSAPTVVVADHFGGGPPSIAAAIDAVASDFANTANPSDHGYMVLGITSGAFDGVGAGTVDAEGVTGIFPGTLPVRAADVKSGLAGAVLHDRMLELVENAPGDVVVNTSLSGWPCATAAEARAYCTRDFATRAALVWIEKVRGTSPAGGANLEGKFLHAASGGNVEPVTGVFGAAINSEWTAAALVSPLVDPDTGAAVPNLTNTLVVENFTASTTEPFAPVCPSVTSELGGTIAGVGSPVHSLDSPATATTFADGGTSAATPQVAAVAAYVWTLKPSLTPAQLAALLRRTARPNPTCTVTTGVIDAYAALLAADAGNPARPVRTAILDVADSAGEAGVNGRFDGHDLDEFLALFAAQDGRIDYGRADLNGDGVTRAEPGVQRRAPVDLDVDETHGVVVQDLEGLPVRFDERALSDENVLCHAAYSPLWQGPLDERAEKLGIANCLRPDLDHTFPQQVQAGVANTLTITASSLAIVDEGGEPLGQEDIHLELEPEQGTTVGATSGSTNADGVFTTTATLADGQPTLSIRVTAYDRPGGDEIATDTVTAQLQASGTATIDSVYAHILVRAGVRDGDDEAFSSSWSLSGSTGDGGSSASVNASASLTSQGNRHVYAGTATLVASGGAPGAAAGVDGIVTVTVEGGPVSWLVRQRHEGTLGTGFCQVRLDNQVVGSTGNAGGFMEPGTHEILHDCGGGSAFGSTVDATLTFSVTIGH